MTDYKDIPEVPKEEKANPEEIFQAFRLKLAQFKENQEEYKTQIPALCDQFKEFLEKKPSPPKEWSERLGAEAEKYDYHQVVLPEDHCDPYKIELENIEIIRDSGRHFMSLEHALISRNYFLYTDGHFESLAAPKPLIMLESHEEDQEVDWDCCFYVWPDGSFYSYNLEGEHEETLGEDSLEILQLYKKVISRLVLKVPRDGVDFGHLGCDLGE